jgi:hypothetical protein
MSDLDDWLNDPGTPAASPARQSEPVAPAKGKLGRGGTITNPATKRVVQTSNPLTNPKPSSKQGKGRAPTPEEELRAQNPALAFPSVLNSMDLDVDKRTLETEPEPEPQRASLGLGYNATIAQLIDHAKRKGGYAEIGNELFKITVQIADGALNGS